jgi:hypothetical protein
MRTDIRLKYAFELSVLADADGVTSEILSGIPGRIRGIVRDDSIYPAWSCNAVSN